MLEKLRKFSKSWIAYLFMGMLIVSFSLFWGISDVFQDRTDGHTVAVVGKAKIDASTFSQEWKKHLEEQAHALSQQTKQPVDTHALKKMAIEAGQLHEVLTSLIQRTLTLQEAKALGVQVSNEQVKEAIQNLEYFQDEDGKFSKEKFHQVLAAHNMTEKGFVEHFRDDLTISTLIGSLTGALRSPRQINDHFFDFDMEKRQVRWTLLTEELFPEKSFPALEEKDLQAFYDAHKDHFKAPEYRTLSVLLVSLENLKKKHTVTPEDVQSEYDRRKGELQTPEQRKVYQLLLGDAATAKKAAELLQTNVLARDVPKLLGEKVAMGQDGGWIERTHLPNKVAQAIFDLQKGQHTQPLRTGNGFYIFVVEDIKSAEKLPLEAVRAKLENELLTQKAREESYELAKKVEDDVASGSTFEEIAKTYQLVTLTYEAIDAEGRKSSGEVAEKGDVFKTLLKVGFETGEGLESNATELPNGDLAVVKVDAVTPSQGLTFVQARDRVHQAAIQKRVQERLTALAKAMTDPQAKLSEGDEKIVKQATFAKPVVFARSGQMDMDPKAPRGTVEEKLTNVLKSANPIGRETIDQFFQARPGNAVHVALPYLDTQAQKVRVAHLVGRIVERIEADRKELEKNRQNFTTLMSQALTSDVLAFYFRHLQSKYPIKINQALLARFGEHE